MSGNEDVLDEAIKSMGLHRFQVPGPKPSGFVNLFQILEERCLKRLAGFSDEYVAPGGIGFGFAENREFNAFADRRSKDVVCIYTSAVRVMWSLFNAMMGIRETFPWIDDIDRLGENGAPPAKTELFFLPPPGSVTEAEESIRRKLALALFDVAMDFLLMHEIGHLWNGHVDLLHQKSASKPLQELHFGEENHFEIDQAQALEFDADGFAIQKVFARAYHENQFAEFSEGLLKDHRVPLDGDHTATWYFTWFAVYSLFRAFDESRSVLEIPLATHPPAELRQACLLTTVAAVCTRQGWSTLSMPNWATVATDAGLEAEKAFCRLRRIGLNTGAFTAAFEGVAFDQIDRYLESWNSLGPQLAPLKRGAQK
jgi:hypothetical protein